MRLSFLIPILLAAGLLALLTRGLFLGDGPGASPLVGEPVPRFDLPPVSEGDPGLSSRTLATGEPVLLNFFASWCVPCRVEHPQLMAMAEAGEVPIYGVDFQDTRGDAAAFLDQHGNPFTAIGFDGYGRVGVDFGVRGVPETFVIDGDGVIRYRHLGPITPEVMQDIIRPALAEAAQ